MEDRKEAQRSCVACRQKQDKNALVRIVRSPEGGIRLDPGGRAPGRGAYLCPREACLNLALKKGSLSKSLHSSLSAEEQEAVRKEFGSLETRES